MNLPQQPQMKQLKKSLRQFYEKKTDILQTKFGMKVKKFGHGYFLIDRMTQKNIPANILQSVERYPCWSFCHQDLISPQYREFFQFMIESNAKQLNFTDYQPQIPNVVLLKGISNVAFPYLKQMNIQSDYLINLEPISFLDAPLLTWLQIYTRSVFSSLSPLSKTNFPHLTNARVGIQRRQLAIRKNYDLAKISRIRMKNIYRADLSNYNIKKCTLNVFSQDLRDLSQLSKIEARNIQNFSFNLNGRKLNNRSLNLQKIIKSLKKKCKNKSIYQEDYLNDSDQFMEEIYQWGEDNQDAQQNESDFEGINSIYDIKKR